MRRIYAMENKETKEWERPSVFSELEAMLEICMFNILLHQSTDDILHKTRKVILKFIKILRFRIAKTINPE